MVLHFNSYVGLFANHTFSKLKTNKKNKYYKIEKIVLITKSENDFNSTFEKSPSFLIITLQFFFTNQKCQS